MLKETQLCSTTILRPPFFTQPGSSPTIAELSPSIEDDNLSLFTMSSIMAQLLSPLEERRLPLKVTVRDHLLLEKMAKELPNVSSTSDPVFCQAIELIEGARNLDQKTWAQQFPEISDARVGRIVDLYLQLYDVEGIEHADGLEDLLELRAGLTVAQGYEKARIASLERDVLFKLSQKGLKLSTAEKRSTAEKLSPLAALSLVWWLHQESQPTLAELSAVIFRPEYKENRIQAAILYNHSHYGNRYGDIKGVSANALADWGMNQLDEPGQPIFSASKALRVIHEGMNAPPAIVQSSAAYLANGFAPKNTQGSYLTNQLPEMILTGCNLVGFETCSQQDFTQFLDRQYPVGSLAFSLKTTLKLHYQLQGKSVDELDDKDTEQLYNLLLQEEKLLQQTGGVGYSPTVIFLSHFSQSNEVEPLTLTQMAQAFQRIAGSIEVAHLPDNVLSTFNRVELLADNIIHGTAIDVEQERFVLELKRLAQRSELNPSLYSLANAGLYKTEQEKIARQLDYLDKRLAYRHSPAAFDEDQAIIEILREKGVRDIHFPRQYTYRQDLQYDYPQKEFDSPLDEFKRRRNASNRFVANMSMFDNNGRPINVFDSLDIKKTEYYAQIKTHPALRAQAIEALIDRGERPEGSRLQHKIETLAEAYQPEFENTRFWGNAWTSLENHWVCKVPLPNPMCTIARVEGPGYRNDKEDMAAGMAAMVMEVSQLRGMERGVTTIANPQGVKLLDSFEPETVAVPTAAELAHQTIQSPHGTPIEVQWVKLKDPLAARGVRGAWVRQGGSGAYWEVDLSTGQDFGVVLKQGPEFIKQGRLAGGGPSLSKPSSYEFNPEIKLGKMIGYGMAGDVFLDANNPGFVLKKFTTQDSLFLTEVHMKGVEFFNRYYGEGSAEFIKEGNQDYIRMYQVPGKTLSEINTKIFPPNAKERFLSMTDDLGYYNIIHNDLNFKNVLYDEKTNTFYPIDFDDAYDGYYSPRDPNDANQPWGIKIRVDDILKHIEKYGKS